MDEAQRFEISLDGALAAIAQVGDLSMGQPLGHSRRVARLARMLAQQAQGEGEHLRVVEQIALLRWSGCTANADGFAHLLGDDVEGRRAMLDHTLAAGDMAAVLKTAQLAVVHCEVSYQIARTLGLGADVESGLCRVFETYDGTGRPFGLSHEHIPLSAYQVVLAGDLDILARAHGLEAALSWISQQADRRYPAALAEMVIRNAEHWLMELDAIGDVPLENRGQGGQHVSLTLVGDVIDLKLPWLAGHSRRVRDVGVEAGRLWGLPEPALADLGKASLIHGLGRAAVSNAVWNCNGTLPYGAVERVQLVPYWTQKATRQISELIRPGEVAAHAYERLDGSGYFRGALADSLCADHRLLAATVAWAALTANRPWRPAYTEAQAARMLEAHTGKGLFDGAVCEAVIAAAQGKRKFCQPRSALLTPRECSVLLEISRGASNKQVARILGISGSTVRTHTESIFRKLGCSTRASATLKGLTLGLIA